MRRRLGLVLAAALLAVTARAGAGALLLAAVGDVRATGAVVWVRGAAPGPVGVEVATAVGEDARTLTVEVAAADDLTGKAALEGLRPATRYRWEARQQGHAVAGEFTTAPGPDDPARVTFLWSGDLGGGGFCRPVDGGYRIFRAMARRAADFFLFVGDTVYADVPCGRPGTVRGANFTATTLDEYRARHRHNREDEPYRAFLAGTPVYAIWDDHEVRNDFAGPSEPLMPAGRRAFLDYWPIVPPADDPTRLFRSFRWGRLLEVFILDTRQYRSPNSEPDGPGKTMLGARQRRWLLDGLGASTATWKAVVSSVSLSIPTGRPERRDSWTNASVFGLPQEGGTGFVTERDAILRALRAAGVKNLVFVVADVHHAEVIQHRPFHDFVLHELVAGPLSATLGRPRPLDQALNPRSIWARGGVYNFGEVTVEPAGLTVRLIDEDGTVMSTHTISPE
jgi:alkaline phosphatase D